MAQVSGWAYDSFARPETTITGRRNFETLQSMAAAPETRETIMVLANALAGILAEITPVQRDRLAGQMTRLVGAPGRVTHWRLPPNLVDDEMARRKWAAVVLLDCIDYIGDSMAGTHSFEERMEWRRKAQAYTQGAEDYPIPLV